MVDTSAQGVGNRIRARRKALGISQPKLAKILSVPQQTISGWENGKAGRPSKLFELANVLCTTQAWLINETGPEVVGPTDTKEDLQKALESLSPQLVPAALEFLRNLGNADADAA